jgi:hypothetical protein
LPLTGAIVGEVAEFEVPVTDTPRASSICPKISARMQIDSCEILRRDHDLRPRGVGIPASRTRWTAIAPREESPESRSPKALGCARSGGGARAARWCQTLSIKPGS